jgi:hypothetical protein
MNSTFKPTLIYPKLQINIFYFFIFTILCYPTSTELSIFYSLVPLTFFTPSCFQLERAPDFIIHSPNLYGKGYFTLQACPMNYFLYANPAFSLSIPWISTTGPRMFRRTTRLLTYSPGMLNNEFVCTHPGDPEPVLAETYVIRLSSLPNVFTRIRRLDSFWGCSQ